MVKFGFQKIDHDLFCIAKRLKKIEKGYQLVFNCKKKRYEVFFENSLAFVAGKFADERVLKKAFATHTRNAKKIFANINDFNQKLEQKERQEFEQKNLNTLHSFLDFANSHGGDVNFDNANTTKWL